MMITVFTPTYNRGNLLKRLYDSLCNQSFKDFEWLIVDDGSKDDTETVIANFIAQQKLVINYLKQENGGKHRAINKGVKEAKGEYFFIADSDDRLPKEALMLVVEEFKKIEGTEKISGICGLDADFNGKLIGSGFPKEEINCNPKEISYKYGVQGDLKEVFRTSVLREYPFPEYECEKFCPEVLVWFRIAQNYDMHFFNKVIYEVEYQPDGITKGITLARINSPMATKQTYLEMAHYDLPLRIKIKSWINYWRFHSCIDNLIVKDKGIPIWAYIFKPLGYFMHLKDNKLVK
ncbi:glycosyltransferase family A protein [Prevotella bivia]|uniref:glycosyltransferase family A protein n=1 Tax=Prevotella bivia TaxID=28125 RepID=UPI00288B981D|nr:glycosyltransferase family A protein [Prevotella bivia]